MSFFPKDSSCLKVGESGLLRILRACFVTHFLKFPDTILTYLFTHQALLDMLKHVVCDMV